MSTKDRNEYTRNYNKQRYHSDPEFRAHKLSEAAKRRDRIKVAFEVYLLEHSKYAQQIDSIRTRISLFKREQDPRLASEIEAYLVMLAAFKIERADLRVAFNNLPPTKEKS